jgi:hypothetical protein
MLMETDLHAGIGPGRYERGNDRTMQRIGYRDRTLHTLLGLP